MELAREQMLQELLEFRQQIEDKLRSAIPHRTESGIGLVSIGEIKHVLQETATEYSLKEIEELISLGTQRDVYYMHDVVDIT